MNCICYRLVPAKAISGRKGIKMFRKVHAVYVFAATYYDIRL
jgi:hypothetical protein